MLASGFNSFGQAILIINVFHAVQYLVPIARHICPEHTRGTGRGHDEAHHEADCIEERAEEHGVGRDPVNECQNWCHCCLLRVCLHVWSE